MPTGRLPAPLLPSKSPVWQTYFLHISKLNKTIFSSARLVALEHPQDSRAWTALPVRVGPWEEAEIGELFFPHVWACVKPTNPQRLAQTHSPTPDGRAGEGQPGLRTHLASITTTARAYTSDSDERGLLSKSPGVIAKSAPSCPKTPLYPFEGPAGSPADSDTVLN